MLADRGSPGRNCTPTRELTTQKGMEAANRIARKRIGDRDVLGAGVRGAASRGLDWRSQPLRDLPSSPQAAASSTASPLKREISVSRAAGEMGLPTTPSMPASR